MAKFYLHHNGASWFVKEEEFFKRSGGLTEFWGRNWRPMLSTSIETARAVADLTWNPDDYLTRVESDWAGLVNAPEKDVSFPRHLEIVVMCTQLEDGSKSLSIEDRRAMSSCIRRMNRAYRLLLKSKDSA